MFVEELSSFFVHGEILLRAVDGFPDFLARFPIFSPDRYLSQEGGKRAVPRLRIMFLSCHDSAPSGWYCRDNIKAHTVLSFLGEDSPSVN